MSKIIWSESRYGGHDGRVNGKLQLVSVQYSSQRTGPKWIVETTLPILVPDGLRGADDLEKAKAMAEELVTRFLRTIGARWS